MEGLMAEETPKIVVEETVAETTMPNKTEEMIAGMTPGTMSIATTIRTRGRPRVTDDQIAAEMLVQTAGSMTFVLVKGVLKVVKKMSVMVANAANIVQMVRTHPCLFSRARIS